MEQAERMRLTSEEGIRGQRDVQFEIVLRKGDDRPGQSMTMQLRTKEICPRKRYDAPAS
jgi:hypothetical protein